MSEKVKVTQEQADWLHRYELTQEQVDHHIDIQPYRKRPDSPIVDWPASKVARALYIGYEVEPEYKIGDWVTVFKKTGTILEIRENGEVMTDIKGDKYGANQIFYTDAIRHATASEIEQEKERRFWSKHGREVKEYRKGDILKGYVGIFEVIEITDEDHSIRFINDDGRNDGFFKEASLEVVCFAEFRLDISHE